jgi:DNA polymerase-1
VTKRILLVDGTNLVMRFAHAMVPGAVDQVNSPIVDQQRPAIMSGITRAIWECAHVADARYAIVAFDAGDSWRKHVYPPYKSSRTVSTRWWSDHAMLYLVELGIRCERLPGYEADDVIATLASWAAVAGFSTAVLSSDSDLLVLASDTCDVYQFGRKGEPRYAKRDAAWICAKYGIDNPAQLSSYKAIAGEPCDDLPGIAGMGPVKARSLIRTQLFENLSTEQREQYKLMLQLVTLVSTAPLGGFVLSLCRLDNDRAQLQPEESSRC